MKKFIQISKKDSKTYIASFGFSSVESVKTPDENLIKIIDDLTNGAVRIEWYKGQIRVVNNPYPYGIELDGLILYLYKLENYSPSWEETTKSLEQ